MEKKFVHIKELKTYTKSYTGRSVINNNEIKMNVHNNKVPLSTQNAVKFLLEGTLRLRVCRYCLSVTSVLSELDEILVIAVNDSLHEVTIRDMVASFHPYKVTEDRNFPNKICSDCLTHTIGSYLFAQQCERAERALRNCFDDMYEKFEKLDPLEPVKKRGKRKTNLNRNVLYTEHEDVINYAEPIINLINVDTMPANSNKISELECQKCAQVLPNTESLLNHEKSHPKSMWYNCRLCGKSFVKQYHLRRHIKENHVLGEENEKDINTELFKCNECGTSSKTFVEHLQHIEKHKFKEMFHHLIDRRTDDLCSVCLGKGSRMVDMGEVIHLHGGYPELTGDKTIQSILHTSIPEKTYKYQELILPKMATILKVTKKYNQQKSIIHEGKDKSTFEFSSTCVLSKDITKCKSSIMFTFSKPFMVNPENIEQRKLDLTSFCFVGKDNIFNKDSAVNIEASETNEHNHKKYTDRKDNDNNTIITCKICWLFKKASCKTCLAASEVKDVIATSLNQDIVTDECNFCWIFSKVGECNYCKKNALSRTVMDNLSNKESEKIIRQYIEVIDEEVNTWQCGICLTRNKNRHTCMCCDGTNVAIKKTNFLFGKENLGKEFISNGVKEITQVTDANDSRTDAINIQEFDTIPADNKSINKELMDIEMTEQEVNTENRDTDTEMEAMDTFKDTQMIESIKFAPSDDLINANIFETEFKDFTFNIGTGTTNKKKRIKEPLRRMATAFHK